MKRNEAIELLEKYNDFLHTEAYVDSDIYSERPTPIDGFFKTDWAKENIPIIDIKWEKNSMINRDDLIKEWRKIGQLRGIKSRDKLTKV